MADYVIAESITNHATAVKELAAAVALLAKAHETGLLALAQALSAKEPAS